MAQGTTLHPIADKTNTSKSTAITSACRPVPYNCGDLPLYTETDAVVNRAFQVVTHVHEDIEIIEVLSGCLHSCIDEQEVYVQAGECLMINANRFHWNMAASDEPCHVRLIVTGQDLLTIHPLLRSTMILPMLTDASVPYITFKGKDADLIRSHLDKIVALAQDPEGNGMEITGYLHLLYASLQRAYREQSIAAPAASSEEILIQQAMVNYITNNYARSITLDEVAAAGNVSRARCCRIFQKYIRQSPMNFLNQYRLSLSLALLKSTDMPVSEIALSCGFGQQSHYDHLFRRRFDCSPKGYRAQCRETQISA